MMLYCSRNTRGASGPELPGSKRNGSAETRVIYCLKEAGPIYDAVICRLEALGYSQRDVFAVRLSLEEALVNAVKHGNGMDRRKEVRVSIHIDAVRAWMLVEDQGVGFVADTVPDPTQPENWERPSGRGVHLMRHFMDQVRYNARGNAVTLCKLRTNGDLP